MGISLKTRKMLWGRSANRCSFPDCRRVLVEDETETDDASIVGDEAHIVAREENGPRGISELTPEQRDKYNNLILMCKVHHKVIDDQENTYTVDVLHQYKRDHIAWVDENLNPDAEKQHDDEVYATYIDKCIELADMNNWNSWATDLLSNGQPSISVEQHDKLVQLNEYLISRVWSGRYENLEFAFENFRIVLNELLHTFGKYRSKWGEGENAIYEVEKIYKRLQEYNEEKYDALADKFDYQVDLVMDLTCELTRAGNYLFDQIRRSLSKSFRLEEGALLITTGPNMKFEYKTVRLEYPNKDKEDVKFQGLRHFMKVRETRGYYYGTGVNEDYFLEI